MEDFFKMPAMWVVALVAFLIFSFGVTLQIVDTKIGKANDRQFRIEQAQMLLDRQKYCPAGWEAWVKQAPRHHNGRGRIGSLGPVPPLLPMDTEQRCARPTKIQGEWQIKYFPIKE